MADITHEEQNASREKEIMNYLRELFHDRAMISQAPDLYHHVERLIDKEIFETRRELISGYGIFTISEDELPEPNGPKVVKQRKVYMPETGNTHFNFVGRILGPNGSTAKCLQQCLGVKIMIRGRGSTRDKKKEESNIGKPYWEHLNDKLHLLLTAEDYENRADFRLEKASEYIDAFLNESIRGSERDDKVKQMQLMELSFRKEAKPLHANFKQMFDYQVKPGQLLNTNPALFNLGYNTFPNGSSIFPTPHSSTHHQYANGPYSHHPGQHGQHDNQQQQNASRHHHLTQPTSPTSPSHPPCAVGLMSGGHNMPPAAPFLMSHPAALAANPYLAHFLHPPGSHNPQANPSNAAALAMAHHMNYWATNTGHAALSLPTAAYPPYHPMHGQQHYIGSSDGSMTRTSASSHPSSSGDDHVTASGLSECVNSIERSNSNTESIDANSVDDDVVVEHDAPCMHRTPGKSASIYLNLPMQQPINGTVDYTVKGHGKNDNNSTNNANKGTPVSALARVSSSNTSGAKDTTRHHRGPIGIGAKRYSAAASAKARIGEDGSGNRGVRVGNATDMSGQKHAADSTSKRTTNYQGAKSAANGGADYGDPAPVKSGIQHANNKKNHTSIGSQFAVVNDRNWPKLGALRADNDGPISMQDSNIGKRSGIKDLEKRTLGLSLAQSTPAKLI